MSGSKQAACRHAKGAKKISPWDESHSRFERSALRETTEEANARFLTTAARLSLADLCGRVTGATIGWSERAAKECARDLAPELEDRPVSALHCGPAPTRSIDAAVVGARFIRWPGVAELHRFSLA